MCNLSHTALITIVHIGVAVIIFYKETKYIFIRNSVLDKIFMQTSIEYILGGVSIDGVFLEYWSAGKAEYLEIVEEFCDIPMAVTKMRAMTFVENHHNAAVLNLLKFIAVPRACDSSVEFLYSGNNNLRITLKSMSQFTGVGRAVNSTRLKGIIF